MFSKFLSWEEVVTFLSSKGQQGEHVRKTGLSRGDSTKILGFGCLGGERIA
jgi:hypothetical protein